MSCLDNLKICKGECCKYFVFTIDMTKDLKNYYNMHENVKVVGSEVYILNKCKNLSKDGKCKIYNSPKKPKICSEGYTQTMDGMSCPENCIYNENYNIGCRKRK